VGCRGIIENKESAYKTIVLSSGPQGRRPSGLSPDWKSGASNAIFARNHRKAGAFVLDVVLEESRFFGSFWAIAAQAVALLVSLGRLALSIFWHSSAEHLVTS
jgi:hypothetical protein